MSATEYAAACHISSAVYELHPDTRTMVEGPRLEVRLPGPQEKPNAVITAMPDGAATLYADSDELRERMTTTLNSIGFTIEMVQL